MDGETAPEGYEIEKCGEEEVNEEEQVTTSESGDPHQIFRMPKRMTVPEKQKNSDEVIEKNRNFWKEMLKNQKITKVLAPMVDQSELAFRMFTRKYGAQLTFTPMIHAHLFVNDGTYRRNALAMCKADRPLVVQFCANKVDTFLSACRLVEDVCDGVDLNLGCPQMVAKRGRYGSWLQDEVDLICEMVRAVRDYCTLPVSCKIRVRENREQTVQYAKRLVDAGATMLTVHGRTRDMKGAETGLADWTRIRDVVEAVGDEVPVMANGNIQFPGDVERCMEATGAVAVMSAEGLLYNPLIFDDENAHIETWKIAAEYLEYARKFHAGTSAIRAHVFRICHHSLLEYEDLRMRVSLEHRIEDFENIMAELGKRAKIDAEAGKQRESEARELFERIRQGHEMDALEVSKQPHWITKPYFRLKEVAKESIVAEGEKTFREKQKEKLALAAQEMGVSLKQARKRERRQLSGQRILEAKKLKFPPCARCGQPAGQGCTNQKCKKCCRYQSKMEKIDCKSHRYLFASTPQPAVSVAVER
uniref:tRNA-dihydrouridine(16/17) synthase [NAD(P)(+)] n=1 Tax=Caenorhabditis japonica TaxID=281687 RepID=A0A8R1HVP3_CAEJA